ncbi:MAG: histone deacetylase [Acidobacteriota bacterium]|nr:histone deacetylase [Acidobacteriota bacterium]
MSKSNVLLISSSRFVDHGTPTGHPEQPARATVMTRVADRWRSSGGRVVEPTPIDTAALARVHEPAYLAEIASVSGRRVQLDADTYASPETEVVARLAVGAAVTGVSYALDHSSPALAFVRPPGHHAERDRAMGFCVYNNAAVAAAHALSRGLERVVVIDYDVHHGNGIQSIFYDDPRVLYISTHQYPFYPGTGAVSEIGKGAGSGFTFNIPLEAGAGDADLDLMFRRLVLPVTLDFQPQLVIVSAGFDAHADDPLGGMRVTVDGFGTLTRLIYRLALEHCDGRFVIVTEGGYHLPALEACLEEVLVVTTEQIRDLEEIMPVSGSTDVAEAALGPILIAQTPYWPSISTSTQL